MAGPIGYSTILGSMSRTLSRLVPAMTSQARVGQRWRAINAIEGALNTLVIIVGEGVTAAVAGSNDQPHHALDRAYRPALPFLPLS
mgnify:CR=1 FL=1